MALADQAVISGASFLTTVTIGRWCLPSELGVYLMGVSLVVSWLGIQDTLISIPYTFQRHRPVGSPAEHAGSSLTLSGLLSTVAFVVMAVTTPALSAGRAPPELVMVTLALAGLLPFLLLREFGRGFAIAHLHMGRALMLDSAVAAMQLAGIGVLAWTGQLSAVTAFAAIGAACALAGFVWLYLARERFVMRAGRLRATMQQSWSLGKWLFANQLTLLMQSQVTYWLLAWIVGTTATGVYAACMSIAFFANPLLAGLGNVVAPKAALAFEEGGGPRLRSQAIRDSLALGLAMTLFGVMVLLVGDDVIRLLFHGKEYEGQGHTITVLAFAPLAMAVGMPAASALTGIKRPRALVWTGSFGLVLTVVLGSYLVIEWGVLGAAYGYLAGNAARSAALWVMFLTLVPRLQPDPMRMDLDSRSAPVAQVLQQLTQSSKDCGWVIELLAEGVEAKVYAARSQDWQPIWQTHRDLVIKLYKPGTGRNVELVRAQFDSLSRLHAALNNRTVNDWKTYTPAPLYVCESPLALVMTMSPGAMLSLCLETDDNMTPEVSESMARAVVAAMQTCWSMGQLHGDLHLDNILCDVVNRGLSFLDMGVPAKPLFLCDDVTKGFSPASHDLAFLLFNAVDGRDHGPVRMRQQMFAERVLRVFIETIGPFEEKKRLLDEIHARARAHLMTNLDTSLSPRGLWLVLVRRIASRRIDRFLTKLRTDVGIPSDAHPHVP